MNPLTEVSRDEIARQNATKSDDVRKQIEEKLELGVRWYANDSISVEFWENGPEWVPGVTPPHSYLSIKRHDRAPIHDWRVLQHVKNELCGLEREGLELYPRDARLNDEANQYHLFVFREGTGIPFGQRERRVNTDRAEGDDGWKQRIEADETPIDRAAYRLLLHRYESTTNLLSAVQLAMVKLQGILREAFALVPDRKTRKLRNRAERVQDDIDAREKRREEAERARRKQ